MSRIGKAPIAVPAGVTVTINGLEVTVKGPKGTLSRTLKPQVKVTQDGDVLNVTRGGDDKTSRSLHGLSRTLVANMVTGVTTGFTKELEINGVGYRANKQGKDLNLTLGYSHPVLLPDTDEVQTEVQGTNKIIVKGIDKQKVGQFAAEIRGKRPPEPYKGKGIKYVGERIIRKEGKAGKGKK
ncbi:MAG: 50S ribosomal protein L6 [Oscillospiraceae bacterium]|jgi:large subunit ribosomal protein L6|nr:50S ribosomal protein L6 [Oscillospiraceae bacterium]